MERMQRPTANTADLNKIKEKAYMEIALNNLFLDLVDYADMTELEVQICCTFENDLYEREMKMFIDKIKSFTSIAEKVIYFVKVWKRLGVVESFMNCELYANYFKFYKDLSDDDYNQLAIKYIVKNNLV